MVFFLLRLEHVKTKMNLHSHLFTSPLSGNQEISAYGDAKGEGDSGDNWTVICTGTALTNQTAIQLMDCFYRGRMEKGRQRHVKTRRHSSVPWGIGANLWKTD